MSSVAKKLLLLAAVTAVTVIAAHGGLNGRAVWNLLPLPVALLPLLTHIPIREVKLALAGFSYTVLIVILAVHLGYLTGMERIFPVMAGRGIMGLPLYSVGAGYLAGMVCVGVGLRVEAGKKSPAEPS